MLNHLLESATQKYTCQLQLVAVCFLSLLCSVDHDLELTLVKKRRKVFEPRTITGSELFSLSCLGTTIFILLSIFSLLEDD